MAAYNLTKREADMLSFLRNDTSTEEIAGELFISAATVRTHISRLLKKLDIASRQEVADWLARYEI